LHGKDFNSENTESTENMKKARQDKQELQDKIMKNEYPISNKE